MFPPVLIFPMGVGAVAPALPSAMTLMMKEMKQGAGQKNQKGKRHP